MSLADKKWCHILVHASLVMAGAFLQSAQYDQKRCAALCSTIPKSNQSVGENEVFEKYVTCIDNLRIFPTVLVKLITQYAYKKISFSAEKITFSGIHPQQASSMLIAPFLLATGSSDNGLIKLWNCKNRVCRNILPCVWAGPMTAFTALDFEDLFASGARNGDITILSCRKNDLQCTFPGHNQAITALARITSDHIISAAADSIKIWDLSTSSCSSLLERADYDKTSDSNINPVISLIPIRKKRFDEVSSKNISKLIIDQGKFVGRIHYHQEDGATIRGAVLAYGDNILIATDEPRLKLVNSQKGGYIAHIDLPYQPTALSYRYGSAFVGHSNGYITVIDMLTKTCVQKFHAHFENFLSCSNVEKDYSISNIIPLDDGSIIVCCVRGCIHSFNEKS